MDAKVASEKVAQYFKSVVSPIGFAVISVRKDGARWVVVCDFWPWLGASERAKYVVHVDEQGGIVEVQQEAAA